MSYIQYIVMAPNYSLLCQSELSVPMSRPKAQLSARAGNRPPLHTKRQENGRFQLSLREAPEAEATVSLMMLVSFMYSASLEKYLLGLLHGCRGVKPKAQSMRFANDPLRMIEFVDCDVSALGVAFRDLLSQNSFPICDVPARESHRRREWWDSAQPCTCRDPTSKGDLVLEIPSCRGHKHPYAMKAICIATTLV